MKRGICGAEGYTSVRTAQGVLRAEKNDGAATACGSACGAGDTENKPEEPKAACGSACGAGDK